MKKDETIFIFLLAIVILGSEILLGWAISEIRAPQGMDYQWRPAVGRNCVPVKAGGGYYCDDPTETP